MRELWSRWVGMAQQCWQWVAEPEIAEPEIADSSAP